MRLVDLRVYKTFIGQPLAGGSYYLRMELRDGLDALRRAGKMTIETANRLLTEAEIEFLSTAEKLKEAVVALKLDCSIEEQPTLWIDDKSELKMTYRILLNLKEDETIEDCTKQLREKMKESAIYLRVSMQ